MNIFKKNLRIKTIFIVLFCLFIAALAFGIWFLHTNNTKVLAILGSLVAGLIVAIIQLIISWQDYNQMEKLKELDLIKVLYDRDDRIFYEDYVKHAKRKIDMMGVTASRFFKDFADTSSNATSNAKVFLEVLNKGVKVRVLLPKSEFVDEGKKEEVEKVKRHVTDIKTKIPNCKLEVKYFPHVAAHSIFNVDDKCIVGPVFPEVESKYTPALFLRNSSPMAHKYLTYFDYVWNRAEE